MSINKVAKLAGVSNSTVSRVINNYPRVAPDTERSVRDAMTKLGYAPSDRRPGPKPANRAKTETKNIAFLVLGSSGGRTTPGFVGLLHGVSMGATDNNLNLTFSHLPDSNHLPARLMDQRMDGVLLHGSNPGPEIRRQLEKVPTVWLMGNRRRPEWGDQVMPDQFAVGMQAAEYLVDQGHRRLAFLNLDNRHWSLRMYYQGFLAAATDIGASVVSLDDAPGVSSQDYWQKFSAEAAERLVDKLLSLSPQPTGLFIADDMQTAMIQPVLQKRGVVLGEKERLQIVSCNNENPYLAGLSPRPASIDIRVESVGQRGVEKLLWRMGHPQVRERIVTIIEPMLVAGARETPSRVDGESVVR